MPVRITRQADPATLPEDDTYNIDELNTGSTFRSLAEFANGLHGWWFRRSSCVLLDYYYRGRNNTDTGSATVHLKTSSTAKFIFVACGYSRISPSSQIEVDLRNAPVEDAQGHSTPLSGALADPGCRWSDERNNLTFVNTRAASSGDSQQLYDLWGLQWAHTGLRPTRVVPGAISSTPRPLQVTHNTEYELEVRWENVDLISVMTWEMYRKTI